MAGSSSVAIESRKQAARRPRPPLPSPASGSSSRSASQSSRFCLAIGSTWGASSRFVTLFARERPIMNSSER